MTQLVHFRSYRGKEIDAVWPEAEPLLARMMRRTNCGQLFTTSDLKAAAQNLDMQLWGVERDGKLLTAIITEVVNYRRCKALRIIGAGGNGLGAWGHWYANLEAWAREIGCTRVEITGRKGWERRLAPSGVRVDGVMYSKELIA